MAVKTQKKVVSINRLTNQNRGNRILSLKSRLAFFLAVHFLSLIQAKELLAQNCQGGAFAAQESSFGFLSNNFRLTDSMVTASPSEVDPVVHQFAADFESRSWESQGYKPIRMDQNMSAWRRTRIIRGLRQYIRERPDSWKFLNLAFSDFSTSELKRIESELLASQYIEAKRMANRALRVIPLGVAIGFEIPPDLRDALNFRQAYLHRYGRELTDESISPIERFYARVLTKHLEGTKFISFLLRLGAARMFESKLSPSSAPNLRLDSQTLALSPPALAEEVIGYLRYFKLKNGLSEPTNEEKLFAVREIFKALKRRLPIGYGESANRVEPSDQIVTAPDVLVAPQPSPILGGTNSTQPGLDPRRSENNRRAILEWKQRLAALDEIALEKLVQLTDLGSYRGAPGLDGSTLNQAIKVLTYFAENGRWPDPTHTQTAIAESSYTAYVELRAKVLKAPMGSRVGEIWAVVRARGKQIERLFENRGLSVPDQRLLSDEDQPSLLADKHDAQLLDTIGFEAEQRKGTIDFQMLPEGLSPENMDFLTDHNPTDGTPIRIEVKGSLSGGDGAFVRQIVFSKGVWKAIKVHRDVIPALRKSLRAMEQSVPDEKSWRVLHLLRTPPNRKAVVLLLPRARGHRRILGCMYPDGKVVFKTLLRQAGERLSEWTTDQRVTSVCRD